MRRLFPLFGSLLLLAACGDKAGEKSSTQSPPPELARTRTVLDFLEDPGALDETWARCRNDPGGLGKSSDCVNAGYANERLMMLGRERAIKSLKR